MNRDAPTAVTWFDSTPAPTTHVCMHACTLCQVIRRRPDYRDRRGSEYVEPEEIYVVATAHTSAASAEAARRVIEEVGALLLSSGLLDGVVAGCASGGWGARSPG